MNNSEQVQDFLKAFVHWASARSDVQAIALVGSHARKAAKEDSDIDLVILTDQPVTYLETTKWAEGFGAIDRQQIEDYGRLTSLRVWYQNGREVEYGFTAPDWAAPPLDAGTQRVIREGMIVLFERGNLLSQYNPQHH